ncbi:hypothetical protein HGO37_23610 [Rhizobium sp. CG4]|uniref:hypothetical protein n=1 Tax=Rhizobium sp. CG4 TaxID=2726075 RepID=UPI00203381BE|nr:hypothetical protein [Rhizobium sp. CG4]MCM2458386.1 hypothetical protein [Rhizobium sp. CG4]
MIPVALPSVEFLVIVGLLFLTTLVWFVWTVWLLFFRKSQKPWANHWFALYGLTTFPALFTLYHVVTFSLEMRTLDRERENNFAPTLTSSERIGQIDMPEGTKLRLAAAQKLESFGRATFPHPVEIAGINALAVDRYITIKYDDSYNVTGFAPDNMQVVGEGTSEQQGWTCKAATPVEFDVNEDGSVKAFKRCVLAAGNAADGISLPSGTEVWTSTGNVYTDGFTDTDRWVMDIPRDKTVLVDGLEIASPRILLDDRKQLYEVSSGSLAKDTSFGANTYPAGTLVRFNPRQIRDSYPNAWLLTPKEGVEDDAILLPPDGTVLDRAGKVLATLPR